MLLHPHLIATIELIHQGANCQFKPFDCKIHCDGVGHGDDDDAVGGSSN